MTSRPELFGTDGIRGAFGVPPLDEPTVRALAAALVQQLPTSSRGVVLGGDTRDSTPVLCRWLGEELTTHGVDVTYLGVVPTPCVATTVIRSRASCGIVVSASHNPHPDNGIKLIDRDGFKWSPAAEVQLEGRLYSVAAGVTTSASTTSSTFDARVDHTAVDAYLDHLAESLPGTRPLEGLSVALDTGNGAASAFAGPLFERLGARVEVIHQEPDGRNINRACGSTRPEEVAELVRDRGHDLGFAFDGDADRAIVVDEEGRIRDGDSILYLWARDLARHDQLPGNRLVATSMSNLGLEVALRREKIEVVRCDVGDRVVVETLRSLGIELGGEQSGHIVRRTLSTTGDGLLTALQVAGIRSREGIPLTHLLEGFERFPQLLRNLPVRAKPEISSLPSVMEASRRVEAQLGSNGRLVLRYSGTEPLVRIMIEGQDRTEIEALADELAEVLSAELAPE